MDIKELVFNEYSEQYSDGAEVVRAINKICEIDDEFRASLTEKQKKQYCQIEELNMDIDYYCRRELFEFVWEFVKKIYK